ncbi:MAG: glycogen synthase [Herpetosiphonaceae bacterium]|nr:glycogen synthase [Herpetosiphonaceae bacterium]
MNILFAAAEVAPLLKTGGLADVAAALPAALRKLGHDVRIVMPRYQVIRLSKTPQQGPIAGFFAAAGVRVEPVEVFQTTVKDTPLYLIDVPAAFDRSQLYGMADDDARFVLFARSVLGLMQHLRAVEGWHTEVVHANDWHAGLLPVYLKTLFARSFPAVASMFTIHNLAYQGTFSPFTLHLSGLTPGGDMTVHRDDDEQFNFMARAIRTADVITTVSPTYAREVLTPEYGAGLDGVLRERRDRLFGVLNGIDTEIFDPSHDPQIAAPYSLKDMAGKAACKQALQAELGLSDDPTLPLIGMVSRLTDQKGLDLVTDVMPDLLAAGAQFIVLGSGDPQYEQTFADLHRHHGNQIASVLKFDAALAQRIYAGCDMFLMPSQYEPGGLGPLIALRYGTVPIVRATGGLNDTVREGSNGNGFRFQPYAVAMLQATLNRALMAFKDQDSWAALRERGMREDFSWNTSAAIYSELYERARQLHGPGNQASGS